MTVTWLSGRGAITAVLHFFFWFSGDYFCCLSCQEPISKRTEFTLGECLNIGGIVECDDDAVANRLWEMTRCNLVYDVTHRQ